MAAPSVVARWAPQYCARLDALERLAGIRTLVYWPVPGRRPHRRRRGLARAVREEPLARRVPVACRVAPSLGRFEAGRRPGWPPRREAETANLGFNPSRIFQVLIVVAAVAPSRGLRLATVWQRSVPARLRPRSGAACARCPIGARDGGSRHGEADAKGRSQSFPGAIRRAPWQGRRPSPCREWRGRRRPRPTRRSRAAHFA